MRLFFAVVLPFVFQALFVLGVIASTNGTGSFVGLAAMLGGLVAIPLTALFNWIASSPSASSTVGARLIRVVLISLTFPALLGLLLLFAS